MDLSNLDTGAIGEAGVKMTLLHPVTKAPLLHDDKDKKSVQTITLASYDSPRWRKANRDQYDAIRERKTPRTAAEVEAETIELLVAATIDWDITLDGSKPAFSATAARSFYTRFLWARAQVDEFAANRGNFIKA